MPGESDRLSSDAKVREIERAGHRLSDVTRPDKLHHRSSDAVVLVSGRSTENVTPRPGLLGHRVSDVTRPEKLVHRLSEVTPPKHLTRRVSSVKELQQLGHQQDVSQREQLGQRPSNIKDLQMQVGRRDSGESRREELAHQNSVGVA